MPLVQEIINAALLDSSQLCEQIVSLVRAWHSSGNAGEPGAGEVRLELSLDLPNQQRRRPRYPVTGFEKPDVTVLMRDYYDRGTPLRETTEQTPKLICEEAASVLADFIFSREEITSLSGARVRLGFGQRTMWGSVQDYWHECEVPLQRVELSGGDAV